MSDNIQEAEVGSGTKVADTKQSEKRAQLTLKAIQLRLKQEKERSALQQQKKSLQVKENIGESFSPSQIAALKAEYSKINGIDPASDTYKKLIAMLDRLDLKSLQSLAGAEIKFVSGLAKNRVARKSMKKEEVEIDEGSGPKEKQTSKYVDRNSAESKAKVQAAKDRMVSDKKAEAGKALLSKLKKEEVQLDELSTNKLADYKKKAGADASAADKAGDTKKGNKRFSGIMKATRKQFDNDAKKTNEDVTEASQRVDSLVTDALKVMQGSELKDAVQALKTVLGDREYNDRRGHYNFYVKQLVDMYGKKANEELDIELDEVLSKDATAGDFIHDFVNSDNPKFAGKSKEKRKQMALAAYYAKQKNEELSPKQKAIDKNKNGKIDGFDLSHLRKKTEELSPKQKALDKNKNGKIDGSDLAKLRKEEVDLQEKSDYEVYHKDYSTAVQTAIKQAEKRGYEVDMDDWHDKVATGPKKPSSGKTNSFSINLMKDGKPAKKKLQMQVYNMDNHKYELNMYIEEIQLDELNKDTLHSYAKKSEKDQDDQFDKIGKGIRDNDPKSANKAGHKFSMRSIGQNRAEKRLAKEAASPAQQAAIAIAMKKDGKEPKDRLPKKPADEYERKVVKYLKKKHGMSEGLMDKIKAIKRGMQAKAKADDHFDKAGDPKNANASKDLKKAVRYHNLLNKEETEIVTEARKKSFKDVKKKIKTEETPNGSTVKKGEALTGKREPIEINPELKEPAR